MRTKFKNLIRPAPLMMTALAIVGALALFGALALPNADTTEAQEQIPKPGAVTALASAPGNGSLTISWTPPTQVGAGLTGYTVRYKKGTEADTAYKTLSASGFATGYKITGLVNGTAYDVGVRATNAQGDGSWANIASDAGDTTTPTTVNPDKPTGISVSQTGTNEITVKWTPVPVSGNGGNDIDGYAVNFAVNCDADTVTWAAGTQDPTAADLATKQDAMEVKITSTSDITDTVKVCVQVAALNGVANASPNYADNTDDPLTIKTLSGIIGTIDLDGDITSSSSTGGSTIELKVTIDTLPLHLPVGSSVVLYLEDDYQEPSSIPASSVYFVATGGVTTDDGTNFGTDNDDEDVTSNGARVYATAAPDIKTDDYFDADKSDIAIRVVVPDMCDLEGCVGGPRQGQKLVMVISKAAGIKNPSELGEHSVAFRVIGATDDVPGPTVAKLKELETKAKASLSKVDGSRGDELTVTGTGFNNGTSAAAYVKQAATMPACDADFLVGATRLGAGNVGSDDKVAITFEVTVPTFKPGNVNWICVADGEGRMSADAQDFKLKPSISISPTTATVGDTVTIFAQDFPASDTAAPSNPIKLANQTIATTSGSIAADGSGTNTFVVPGWAEGTLRVDAWGENTKITVIGSTLNISKSEALPNELLTITGDGFSTGNNNYVMADMITIDGVALKIHKDSITTVNGQNVVEVSSSGQFVATIVLWPDDGGTNPALTAGVHTIEVEDNNRYSGSVTVTIPEPTIMVTPEVAGPRDIVTISGTNWPIDNLEGDAIDHVTITVDDGNRQRTYSTFPDSAGRFFVEHRVATNVAIPSTNRVTATYSSEVVEVATFEVPAAIIMVSPGEGQPGDAISLSVDKMPVYASVDKIQIAGRDVMPAGNFSTDRTGSVSVEGVIIPGLDPGVYSILMDVDDTVAIGSVEVLSEGPIGTEVPVAEALEALGESLSAVFHFDNVSKSWNFYDPRPEFAELNTLTSLVNGEAYWVLITEDVEDVVLNQKSRTLTCSSGGDCWNLMIW